MVDLQNPFNAGILAHLSEPGRIGRSVSAARDCPSCSPDSVDDAHLRLGTHPDLVARLWDELGASLPEDCRWVVHGTPSLVHPASGIVFAFGCGTHTYALRLPPRLRPAALASGATTRWSYPAYPELGIGASALDLASVGPEWVFGKWLPQECEWCRAAYAYAAPGS